MEVSGNGSYMKLPQNECFMMEAPIQMDELGLPPMLVPARRYLVPLEEVKKILDEFKQIDTSAPVIPVRFRRVLFQGPPER